MTIAGCVDLYHNHDLWSAFGRIVDDAVDAGVNDLKNDESDINITVHEGINLIHSRRHFSKEMPPFDFHVAKVYYQ